MEAFEITDVLRTLDELPHRREPIEPDDGKDDAAPEFTETRFEEMGWDERYKVMRVVDELRRLFTVAEAREAGASSSSTVSPEVSSRTPRSARPTSRSPMRASTVSRSTTVHSRPIRPRPSGPCWWPMRSRRWPRGW